MIPAELRALPQWVAWRVAPKPEGKPTKVPYCPTQPDRKASSTDPATWGTYHQALAVVDAEGVGFVFTPDDPYVGVDMDACIGVNGTLHHAAYDVVKALSGYVEFSPSGSGLHIIVRGRLERGRHTLKTPWGNELAVYGRGRFFTMLGDGRGQVRDAQPELDALMERFFPSPDKALLTRPKPVSGDDGALLVRMFASLHGDRIRALWDGDAGDDHSAADLALCSHLAYFTGGDPDRVDSLFRQSGLMRGKWDEPRGVSTYGHITILRSLEGD